MKPTSLDRLALFKVAPKKETDDSYLYFGTVSLSYPTYLVILVRSISTWACGQRCSQDAPVGAAVNKTTALCITHGLPSAISGFERGPELALI